MDQGIFSTNGRKESPLTYGGAKGLGKEWFFKINIVAALLVLNTLALPCCTKLQPLPTLNLV